MKRTVTLSSGREVTVDDEPEQTGIATVWVTVSASFVPTDSERDEIRKMFDGECYESSTYKSTMP